MKDNSQKSRDGCTFYSSVLCQNIDDPFKEGILDSVGRPASSLLQFKTNSGTGGDAKDSDMGQGGREHALIFPGSLGGAGGACFTLVTTRRNFSIPIPTSNHNDEAGSHSHPQSIQRTNYVLGQRIIFPKVWKHQLKKSKDPARCGCCEASTWHSVDCAARQPSPVGLSQQEHCRGLPHPPPGKLYKPRDQTRVSDVSCFGKRVLYH